jgi:hypothetical protein
MNTNDERPVGLNGGSLEEMPTSDGRGAGEVSENEHGGQVLDFADVVADAGVADDLGTTEVRAIAAIKVGSRHRRDLGDIAALAESIEAIGLLHPVTVDTGGNLLAGTRRLEACKRLGWTNIPVRFVGARP